SDPVQWKDLSIYKFKSEEITSIEITKPTGPPLNFAPDTKGGWRLATGEGTLDTVRAQSLCNTLASLNAVRWTGANMAGLGLEKPSLVISFTANNQSHKLTVGSAT